MASRKCSGCGWEYPLTWPGRTCRFCHAKVPGGVCSVCGELKEHISNGKCRECQTRNHMLWRQSRRSKAEELFNKWLYDVSKIQKPYTTLTEDQWLEACKYFKGCAYCGKPDIDARSMFIPFKHGGRYCNWNIIPSCESCENINTSSENPFLYMDRKLMRGKTNAAKKCNFTEERLHNIAEYLHSKMGVNNEAENN